VLFKKWAKKKQENKGNEENNSRKESSIKRIEDLLAKRDIKAEELEPNNRDYRSAINSAEENVIIDVEDRIKDDIILKDRAKKGQNSSENKSETEHTTTPRHTIPPSKG